MENNYKNDLGRNIFILRKAKGISHENMVNELKISRPVLSSIENGNANITFDNLIKISSYLKVSLEMLLLSEEKFKVIKENMKSLFEKVNQNEAKIFIDNKNWKILLEYSGSDTKLNCSKVSKACSEIFSFSENQIICKNSNTILGAALGVIFQKDGFEFGLNFGAWLGNNFYTIE